MSQTILVCSGKGGVGKTTISANIGKALSKDHNVALLDLDLACPNLPIILGMDKDLHVDVDANFMYPKRFENMEVFSSAFLMPPGVACTWNGVQRMHLVEELLNHVKWSPFEYRIIDFLPGCGDELTAAIRLLPNITGAIIVSNSSKESISDAQRLVNMFQNEMFNVPIIGYIENMSYLLNGKEKIPLFSDEDSNIESLGIPQLGEIPHKKLTLRDFTHIKNRMLKRIVEMSKTEEDNDGGEPSDNE